MTTIRIEADRITEATATVEHGALVIALPDPQPAPPAAGVPADNPPPAPAKALLRVGFHPTPAEYGTWLTKLPTPWFTRVFYSVGKGLPTWGGPAVTGLPAQTIRHISFKDRVSPAAITAFLDSIPAAVPAVWLTWHHEGDIDWACDVAGYVNYWKVLRAAADAHPNRAKVTLVNVHTQYPSRVKRQQMNWRDFMLPGIADVDSWDCYRPGNVDVYEAPEALLGLALTAQREYGVRTHITEYGSHPTSWDTDGAGQAQWLRESLAIMSAAGVEAVGLWCNVDGAYEYRPTKPKALATWKDLIIQYNSAGARA